LTGRIASLTAFLAGALFALALPSGARAGGFYLLDRGTRALGRGGAQVAGADDPDSLWYNPAGLGFAGEQLLIDATMSFLQIDYARIDGGGNGQPNVHGQSAPVPIPTLAGTFDFGLEHVTLAAGLFAPNAALLEYPEKLEVDGAAYPAPQRYSLLSMHGSAIASVAVGAAWMPLPRTLSIGFGVHLLSGSFAARTALSACDNVICTFPEDPDYDGIAQITLAPLFAAIAVFGVSWNAGPVRIGASVSTPFSLSGSASIQVRPPAAAIFDGATVRSREASRGCDVVPDEEVEADPAHPCRSAFADVSLDFPWIFRAGVEMVAIENLRLELAVVWETWSVQRDVLVRPREVWIVDALGGSLDYEVGALSIPRQMRDTVSVRLGGEYTIDDAFQIRAGGYFENGAFDDAFLSPLTIDSDKLVFAAGASARLFEGFWADVLLGYAHLFSRRVRDSRVPQPNPIRPPLADPDPSMRQPGDPVYIGNGDYSFALPFVGLGVRWQPDGAPRRASEAPASRDEGASDSMRETTGGRTGAVEEAAPGESGEVPAVDPARPWFLQPREVQPAPSATPPVPPGSGPEATTDTPTPPDEETPSRRLRQRGARRRPR
jgi:long-chain fatty acid transport protein